VLLLLLLFLRIVFPSSFWCATYLQAAKSMIADQIRRFIFKIRRQLPRWNRVTFCSLTLDVFS
jgi:hypothetical protein